MPAGPSWPPAAGRRRSSPIAAIVLTNADVDAVAVQRRAWVAHRNDLHGVALWALGNDDPLTWDGLRAARLGEEQWGEVTPPTSTSTP